MPSGSWTCRGGPMDSDETVWMARLIEVVAAASRMGYGWVSIGQHWI